MTVYVDTDALKASLTLTGTTYADDDVDAVVAAASGAIEKAMGRDYGKSAEDETRYFTPTAARTLHIDDLAELTSVRVDPAWEGSWETWTLDTDFWLGPGNAALNGQPYTMILPLAGKAFPTGRYARVEVVGRFGWPSPPAQIVEAATLVAAQLLRRRRDTPFAVLAIGDAAAYITRNDPQVAALLHNLGRRKLFA